MAAIQERLFRRDLSVWEIPIASNYQVSHGAKMPRQRFVATIFVQTKNQKQPVPLPFIKGRHSAQNYCATDGTMMQRKPPLAAAGMFGLSFSTSSIVIFWIKPLKES